MGTVDPNIVAIILRAAHPKGGWDMVEAVNLAPTYTPENEKLR